MQYLDNESLMNEAIKILQTRLPEGWLIRRFAGTDKTLVEIELVFPGGGSVFFQTKVCAAMDPRGVIQLKAGLMLKKTSVVESGPVLVLSRYLAPPTRQKLVAAGFNFVDLTGNVRIVFANPPLFIELSGADRSPFRQDRKARTLKGPKVGRIVRALVDFRESPGVRELAARAGVDAGYLSRALALLEQEALIDRGHRGCVARLDWSGLLRRWAVDSPMESRCELATFIEPRGLKSVVTKLASSDLRYTVTGSLAAVRTAPVAPARLAMIYVDDIDDASELLGLRPAENGANVVLARPVDEVVFQRCSVADGVTYAAIAQITADLLSSPGRGPAEGEELLNWMAENEETWRG